MAVQSTTSKTKEEQLQVVRVVREIVAVETIISSGSAVRTIVRVVRGIVPPPPLVKQSGDGLRAWSLETIKHAATEQRKWETWVEQ
ncbi:hypothetical protein L1987_31283 [Smallanthus sonchifolius]|uniref:Uncharacterized protein n=1 Tax=Smallanthus sonchifolius TaxID=185202 RepID=A0ACB9I551_9ASTR|nr:hypothetical protein L1987_31283 [Smallanthus sonchifolius]